MQASGMTVADIPWLTRGKLYRKLRSLTVIQVQALNKLNCSKWFSLVPQLQQTHMHETL